MQRTLPIELCINIFWLILHAFLLKYIYVGLMVVAIMVNLYLYDCDLCNVSFLLNRHIYDPSMIFARDVSRNIVLKSLVKLIFYAVCLVLTVY